jgi:flagellar biosynthesis/type III secretory pathway protein FliH
MSDFNIDNSIEESEASRQEITRQRSRAEHIVMLARKKGEQIISGANESAKLIEAQAQKEGYQKGYEEGLERGYIKGQEEYRNKTEEIINQLIEAEKILKNMSSDFSITLSQKLLILSY